MILKKAIFVVFILLIFVIFLGNFSKESNLFFKKFSKKSDYSIKTANVLTPALIETRKEKKEFLVSRVIDGDTIELENGQKVRYIGINTPESIDPRKPIQCFGIEAANKNKELVEGKVVRLEKDISETDKYGRLLRYVYVGEIFVNDYLVREGYAYVSTYPPDVKFSEQFLKTQKEAQLAKKGLWGKCKDNFYQSNLSLNVNPFRSSDCLIKGNINSRGEKIYHLPNCSSYSKTRITETRGEKWFCSEKEALEAGWRKALNCP